MVTTLESQISLWDLNKGVKPLGEIKTNDFELEHGNIYEEIEMKTFSKFPKDIHGLQSEHNWATNLDYKMNNRSNEMMSSSEYQQTSTSSNFSSMN